MSAQAFATPFQLSVPAHAKGSVIDKSPCVKRLRTALSALGYQLELVYTPSRRALQQSSSGQIDGALARSNMVEAEYTNLRRVAMPCATMQPALYALKGQSIALDSYDDEAVERQAARDDAPDLANADTAALDSAAPDRSANKPMTWKQRPLKKIAYFRGSSRLLGSLAESLSNYDLVFTDSTEQGIKLLQANRVDAVFLSKPLYKQLESTYPELVRGVGQLTPELDDVQLYTYLHKRHEVLIVQLDKLMGASGLPAGQ